MGIGIGLRQGIFLPIGLEIKIGLRQGIFLPIGLEIRIGLRQGIFRVKTRGIPTNQMMTQTLG